MDQDEMRKLLREMSSSPIVLSSAPIVAGDGSNHSKTRAEVMRRFRSLAYELLTQDVRATSHPIYMVKDVRLESVERGEEDVAQWEDVNGNAVPDDLSSELYAAWDGGDDEITHGEETYYHCYYTKTYRVHTACLTYAGANAYIEQNRHNLNEPFVYVESGWRNEEWVELRGLILLLCAVITD